MTTTVILSSTRNVRSVTGQPHRADAWYGFTDGLHTVAMQVANFQGRIHIEGSLADQPEERDWFPIQDHQPYWQFPRIDRAPTGITGDSGVVAFSFRANIMWIRARVDREYLHPTVVTDDIVEPYGTVEKIILSR